MPRINNDFIKSVVFIYSSRDSLESGKGGGTGFLYGIKSQYNPNGYHPYLVTNRHVIENTKSEKIFVQINKKDGSSELCQLNKTDWTYHKNGDDLAIVQIRVLPRDIFDYYVIEETYAIDDEFIGKYDVGAGDEAFMIGRFTGIDPVKTGDKKRRCNPVVRFGNYAMNQTLPIYNEKIMNYQDSYLLEMRSIPGFSGSPVFIYINPFDIRPDTRGDDFFKTDLLWEQRLLGITWGYIPSTVEGWMIEDKRKKIKVRLPSTLAAVVPISKLQEMVMYDKFIESRNKSDNLQREKDEVANVAHTSRD